jgi:uncharacterized protein YpmS
MKYIFFITIITVCCFIILVDSLYLSKRGEALTMADKNSAISESYNKTFHESPEDIQQQLNVYIPPLKDVSVLDDNGNSIKVSIPKYLGAYTYYTPGSYKYSASSFVPSYEDSIYLSRSIGVVPKLDREFYIPSSDYRLNSIESPFTESDDLISTSSDWLSQTPNNNQLKPEESDNVNFAKTDNKLGQLTNTYNMEKTGEVIAYENKANDLLNIQKKILSYATLAPLNVQPKIISPNILSYSSPNPISIAKITPSPLPRIRQNSKRDIYKLPANARMSANDILNFSDQ